MGKVNARAQLKCHSALNLEVHFDVDCNECRLTGVGLDSEIIVCEFVQKCLQRKILVANTNLKHKKLIK